MAFEKAKVLKAAEKFLSQGNISAAIQEYRQIVKHDADDFTTLNMLGDLCVRAGKNDEAISCFLRIAEHYREQEFTLKAIAMFKKIDRLNPRQPEIAEKLAALYVAEGLVVDARAHYLIVADVHSKNGDQKRALEVLHKIADLDPQNIEVRLKLAESYLKEGLKSEAVEAFTEGGTRLLDNLSFERALQAFSRALELRPQHQPALRGLVSAHVALGTAYEATELIEKILSERPDDVELINLLLEAYLEAQDAAGAERTTTMLMERDASHYARFLDVARLYLNNGEFDGAARVLAGITERVLAGREENQLLELVNEVLAHNPEHITGLRLLVRIHWWQRDMEKLRSALERLSEAAEADGLAEDERYALTQLVRLVPDEPRYAERLQALGGAQEETLDQTLGLGDASMSEAQTFDSFAIVKDKSEQLESEDGAGTSPATEFEFHSVSEPVSDPSASFADLNEEFERGEALGTAAGNSEAGEVDFSGAQFEIPATGVDQKADPVQETARRDALLRQELESVDFYIAQGYVDIALDTLTMLERQFHSHPEIQSRRDQLREMGAGQTTASQASAEFEFDHGDVVSGAQILSQPGEMEFAHAKAHKSPPVSPAGKKSSPQVIDSGLADLFEEFRAEAEADSTTEDYETHYNMGTAYKEMDLMDEAIREFQTAVALVKEDDGTPRFLQCCNMLGHCFAKKGLPKAAVRWFKQGLDTEGHSEDEYQALRYELGAAFEQMGDFNRAIDTFTEVYSVDVSYRGVAEKLHELQARKAAAQGKKPKAKGRK